MVLLKIFFRDVLLKEKNGPGEFLVIKFISALQFVLSKQLKSI